MLKSIISFARVRAGSALLFGALFAPAGMSMAADAVREYVDETSAISVTITSSALIFARERSDLAANARDYITLAPLETNRTGERSYFWMGYIWSTIDRRKGEPMIADGDELVLLADGRPIRLVALDTPLSDRGVVQPPLPAPKRNAIPVLFAVNPESIAYAAHATDLHIELLRAGTSETFVLWKDARAAVRAFAERVGAD